MQLNRWQMASVEQALETRRIVILAGARQTGKTTLSKMLAKPKTEYRTLDDKILLEAALSDPEQFIKHQNNLMIIDEIQKAPDLLPALKKAVDENNTPGQYLLTGSANIQSLPGVKESLAGRIRKIPLRPLSQGEITSSSPTLLNQLFSQKFNTEIQTHLERDNIIEIAMRGGYPEVIDFSFKNQMLWYQDYINALLERDLKDIANIQRLQTMNDLVHIVAAWSTKPMDLSAIGTGLSIKRPTIQTYLNALETLYLIEYIQPWTKTDYARVGKKAKLIMNDTGLMTSLLKWKMGDVRLNSDRLGKLIETHVGNELQKHIDTSNGEYALFHYRDREKREIDFIVERDNGELVGIEVKASTVVEASDFKHLKWFQSNLLPNKKKLTGYVLYAGKHTVSFGENLWALPISTLYGDAPK